MKQQTAVEWLASNLEIIWEEKIIDIVERAKAMEQKQIMDATYYGHLKGWVDDGVDNSFGEQYYNETFKSEQL
jgi:hypothetical protein